MKAEVVSLDPSEASLSLGERVFNLLPETVSGKLSGSYNREEMARQVLQELGKGKRDDKSLYDGVVSALYLDGNIPSSIKKSLLKHLGNRVPAQENETLKFFKQVNKKLENQQTSKGETLDEPPLTAALDSTVTEDSLRGGILQQNSTPVDTHRRDDDAIDREVRATGVDMYPDHSERLEQKKYIARAKASKRLKKATIIDALEESRDKKNPSNAVEPTKEDVEERDDRNDVSAPGNSGTLSDDQKVSLPHEGYFGSPEYREAVDDQSPDVPIVLQQEIDWKEVQRDFDEEGKKVREERAQSVKFNRLDAQETFDEETKRLENRDRLAERFRGVKSFDELSVLLNDPEFPGIQGSKQFYSGDDLKRIIAMARETGATNFATRSHGFLDTVERLLREEKEGKTGALKEDDIVEGFGVVSEKVSENVFGETMDLKPNIPVISEKKERNGGEESSLEGEYLPAGEESLQELRERIKTLKHSADESRNRFLALRHRNTSKWLAIKKALFPLRSKEPPESMVNELNLLKSDWTHKLTLYKDAVVELAKRGVAQRELGGKTQGELMAEAIRGLDLQGSIENYDAWKNASWGDRKDSGFLRALGRARDWAEQYRKLDWKKRVAISAAVVGTGVAGVAVGSAGLVGLGVAGSTLVRLLGAYGAGRGSYEFLEGRAAQKTLKYHEAALSHVEKIKDIGFLEQRMKSYADRTQKDLDRAIAGNRKRVIASVALGSALFLGGSAFAYRGAIQEFSGKVSSGFSKFLEQAKIISGLEDFHAAPVSITGAGDGVTEAVSSVSPPMGVESGGIASDAVGAGMINHDVAAEIAGKIGKDIHETVLVQKNSSVEATLIKFLTEQHGINKEEAQGIAHRIVNNYVNTHPVSMQELSLVQPDTKLGIIPNPDNAKMPFKLSSVEFAPTSGAGTVAGAPVEVPVVEPAVAELTPLEPVHVSDIQPAVQLEPMNPISLPEPGNLPSSLEPPDAFDKYKGVAVAGAAIGAAASAVGGGALAWSEIAKMRARRKVRQETMREKEIEDTRKKNGEFEAMQKRANEVVDQVLSIVSFPDDRKEFLREIRNRYGVYGDTHPSEEAFRDTMGKIAGVLFGSEAVLQNEDILGNMFLAVAQRGIGDPGNKNLAEIRTGIKNGYSVFQVLFGKTGERLPAGKITGLSVRDVLRLFTERFLTGKMPEELRESGV